MFGSFATGLYLPTSDMDLVVTESGCHDVRSGLRALASALARKGMAKNMQVRQFFTHMVLHCTGMTCAAVCVLWRRPQGHGQGAYR